MPSLWSLQQSITSPGGTATWRRWEGSLTAKATATAHHWVSTDCCCHWPETHFWPWNMKKLLKILVILPCKRCRRGGTFLGSGGVLHLFCTISQTVCHNMCLSLIITESQLVFLPKQMRPYVASRLPIQGQNHHSNPEHLGGWTPTHAEGEVVAWQQLLGWGASWNGPHGHPEPGWHIHRAGIWPSAVCFRGNCWIHLQA